MQETRQRLLRGCEENERRTYYYIDIAKAFGIIAIVLGHIYGDGYIRHILYAFHVPLFFFLSALFFNTSKSLPQNLKEKFRIVMIPYYLVALLSIGIYAIFGNFVARTLGKSLENFLIRT